jgi:hypothetical protein
MLSSPLVVPVLLLSYCLSYRYCRDSSIRDSFKRGWSQKRTQAAIGFADCDADETRMKGRLKRPGSNISKITHFHYTTPTRLQQQSCSVRAASSVEPKRHRISIFLSWCAVCRPALYCCFQGFCREKDWKERAAHANLQASQRGALFHEGERSLGEGTQRFFKLLQESTVETSRAAARKMSWRWSFQAYLLGFGAIVAPLVSAG